ncbi:MAG: hypothetical protein H0W90_15935 [Actinobacteria bacterium]|nr:hypothetical protein [Actinomycetota bacterium]
MWKPEIPLPEDVEASFPRDVFNGAVDALDRALWIDVSAERHDLFLTRGGEAENQLEETVLIWNRIGDDRMREIEARRRFYDEQERLGVSNVTLGDGSQPTLEEHWHTERETEIALRVDFKSLFVFGETLIATYIVMSEPVWEAPSDVNHGDGPTKFITSVRRTQNAGKLPAPFSEYMDVLLDQLTSVDEMLGFYRDKFVIHLPPDMLLAGSGGSLGLPLDFHFDHAPRREVAEAELRELGRQVQQIAEAEGVDLGGGGDDDPRSKLQQLTRMRKRLKEESSKKTVQRLLRDWGMTSPPALDVARALNDLLETWGNILVEKVGLIKDEPQPSP